MGHGSRGWDELSSVNVLGTVGKGLLDLHSHNAAGVTAIGGQWIRDNTIDPKPGPRRQINA
jgi:hypothetical protein